MARPENKQKRVERAILSAPPALTTSTFEALLPRRVAARATRVIVACLIVVCGSCSTRVPPRAESPSARPADSRATFAQAYEFYLRGDVQQALPLFRALEGQNPALADYHLYFIGMISARLGDATESERAFTELIRQFPQSVKASAARLELGRLYLASDRIDEARAVVQPLAVSGSTTDTDARLLLAEADEADGNAAGAYAGFMAVRRSAPSSRAARLATERIGTLRLSHPELNPVGAERLTEAQLLLAQGNYRAATDLAQSILADPQGVDEASALRVYADALSGQGRRDDAVATLRQLADHYPDDPAAPAALFRAASLLWNSNRDDEALSLFEKYLQRYPHAENAPDALYAIGRIDHAGGRDSEGLQRFDEVVQRYPDSKIASEARWRIGWISYTSAQWRPAAAAFGHLADIATGESAAGATYWLGRALEHSGDHSAATRQYERIVETAPNGYYAMWARARLRGSSATRVVEGELDAGGRVPVNVPAVSPGPFPGIDTFHSSRAEALRQAGVYDLSRGELAAIEQTSGGDPEIERYLLRAYQSVDGYAAAIRLAQRSGGASGSADEQQHVLYPLAFWTPVRRDAGAQGINPLLIEAIMRQESRFDPQARSPANALGLLQLLPSTAERVAGGPIDSSDLLEPETNIRLGVRYLRSVLDRFAGDPIKAVAAYNGGEAAVERWERQFGNLETDEFVESITYRETRDYVKRVVGNYRMYSKLYRRRVTR